MIRVFLLGVLGLIALALVARNLPEYAVPVKTADDSAPFARFTGVWEGEFISRRPDGTPVETTHVRREYTALNSLEQNVVITDQHASGVTRVSNGINRSVPGGLEYRVTDPNGVTRVLEGRREGGAIFWHRRDPTAGIEESFREEILRTPDGDLHTIDGIGVYGGSAGTVLLFEGRYRRPASPPR